MPHFDFQAEFPRERELDGSELVQSRASFELVFDEMLEHTEAEPLPYLSLFPTQTTNIELQDEDGKTTVSTWLTDHIVTSPDGIVKEISLTTIDGEGHGRGSSYYRLFSDGVVRRFDIPDQKGVPSPFKYLTSEMSSEQVLAAIESNIPAIETMHANHLFAEQIGANNQPVHAEEIEAIAGIARNYSKPQ